MDYCGTLEDCSSLELAVLGKDDIQRLTAARKLWGQGVPEWKLRERDLSALRYAQNNLAFVNSLRVVVDELTLKREIILQITTTSDS